MTEAGRSYTITASMETVENKTMPCIVPFDVHDVYGHIVIEAGVEMTSAVLEEIAAPGRFASSCTLGLRNSRIMKDMKYVLGRPPYSGLFTADRRSTIMAMFNELNILPVLFEELEFMRTKERYVYTHALGTAALSVSMAIDLYGEGKASFIGYTALTRDLGMTRLPGKVLKQKIVKDDTTSRILQSHPIVGHILLTYYMGGSHSGNCRVALLHHERRNGMGYPTGIALDDSVVELVTAADAFGALLSTRPYRKTPFELRSALDVMWVEGKQGLFTTTAVKLLIAYSRADADSPEEDRVAEDMRFPGPVDNNYINWSVYQTDKKKCDL